MKNYMLSCVLGLFQLCLYSLNEQILPDSYVMVCLS